MKFPDRSRVIYEQNPLSEVVCQVRFPRILALDEKVPSEFQQRIGVEFPIVEAKELHNISITISQAPVFGPRRLIYEFSTLDGQTKIALCSEYVAIFTTKYSRWETFRSYINAALSAINHIYSVELFTRVGLRYQNIIDRSTLGVSHENWISLIRGSALGLACENEINLSDIQDAQSATIFKLDIGNVLCRCAFVRSAPDKAFAFMIDNDFYVEGQIHGTAGTVDLLAKFNAESGRAFRWFITDKLHSLLLPSVVNG